METQNGIISWVNTKCDPNQIPAFLLELGLKDGDVNHASIVAEINRQAKEPASTFTKEDKGIQNFLTLLKSAPTIKEGRIAQGGKCYINLSHFILSKELKESLLDEYVSIKAENRRLAALIIAVEENFPELWNHNPGGKEAYFANNGCLHTVYKRFMKFLMLLDPAISEIEESPNCDSTGAYSHYYFSTFYVYSDFSLREKRYCSPLDELEEKFKGSDYTNFRFGDEDDSMKKTLSLEVLVAYGLDQAEIIYKNLLFSISMIEESSEVGYKQRILDQFCHDKFNVVKENPSIMAFTEMLMEKYDLSHILNYDMDVDTGIIAYIGGRSEYGNSGGTALFSQIIIWLNGQETMKEFQYRDRFSGSNDKYAYEFKSVKIIEIKKSDEYLNVTVEAKPAQERFSSTRVDFRINNEKPKNILTLNSDDQLKFSDFFNKLEESKLADVKKWHSRQTGTAMAKDYSGDVPYPEPRISSSIIKAENSVGAFVTMECIDARVTDYQWRYTLYLVKGEKMEEIFQNNAYESQGDASIFGLEIFGDKLKYSTRNGRKEYQLT